MIEALSPDRSDQPFCKAVLPGRPRRFGLFADAHGTNAAQGDGAIDAIVVSDQIAWCLIPREGLGELSCDPFRRRILCRVDPDQISAVQPDYDKGIMQLEPDGRDHEQVHGRGFRSMVALKVRNP
jgi:hypothetical protein